MKIGEILKELQPCEYSKLQQKEIKKDMCIRDRNESGLYALVLRSKLPGAKKFRRWVTSEVLPQIRKTGGYIPISEEMSEAEIMAKAFIISRKTIEKKDELLKANQIGDTNKDAKVGKDDALSLIHI